MALASETEVNARLAALQHQRDVALAQNVMDAGTIAVLQEKVKALERALENVGVPDLDHKIFPANFQPPVGSTL